MAHYNLESPNRILKALDLDDLLGWMDHEVSSLPDPVLRTAILHLSTNLDAFVRWAPNPLLFWAGCDRNKEEGKKQKYHKYPPELRALAKKTMRGFTLDTRPNGPAIAAFTFAGGVRPERYGSTNSWSIHHIYSGKFPYVGQNRTLHASKHCLHFTQSAGLLAVHPMADGLCDEYPPFTWLLRAHAFLKFNYDPDGVFRPGPVNDYGFHNGFKPVLLFGE